MKRNIFTLLIVAIIIFSGCQKDKELGQQQPKVTNEEVITTSNSATISWSVDFPGAIHTGIEIGLTEDLADARSIEASKNQGDQNTVYSVSIDSLLPMTKYYYRQVVWNSYKRFELETKCLRKLCYTISVLSNPSNGGTITGVGLYEEGQHCTVTALASTGFFFSNWTENDIIVSDSASFQFDVMGNRTLVANFSRPSVDLCLPSGTIWATCNIGSNAPESIGSRFAWGEINPKNDYSWNTYHYCNGSYSNLTKYCNNSSYGNNGFTDNLVILLPEDDAATANWGTDWRIPTKEEWQELCQNTTHIWTTQNSQEGMLFTASNGSTLFLPAGYYYWSSSLDENISCYAWSFYFSGGGYGIDYLNRFCGLPIRAVRSGLKN